MNIKELEQKIEDYLLTKQDEYKEEFYGTAREIVEEFFTEFILFVKEKTSIETIDDTVKRLLKLGYTAAEIQNELDRLAMKKS